MDMFEATDVNTTVTGTGFHETTTREVKKSNGVIPMFLIDILHNDDKDTFDAKVRVLAVITRAEVEPAKTAFHMHDFSGSLTATFWHSGPNSQPNIALNKYYEMFASLKYMNGEPVMKIINIEPVDDLNFVTLFCLQVFYTNEMENKHAGGKKAEVAEDLEQFNPVQRDIYKIIVAAPHASGYSIDEIIGMLNYNPMQIRNEIMRLATEGHLYSTIDDNHFKPTMGDIV